MKHLAKRALTFLLVFAMLLSTVAMTALADEDTLLIAPNPNADPNKHELNPAEVEPFGQGTHKDGDTSVSADGYFTFLWSEKTKVETNKKEFPDGFTSTVRINFNNGATLTKDAIKFTTAGAASVKIWWGAGDAGRQMTLLDASGAPVATTEGETVKDALYISTLELEKAGTYYLGGSPKKNYIYRVEVTETAAQKEYVLDASTFTEGAKEKALEEKAGTDEYFTINWGDKGKITKTTLVFDDEFAPGLAVSFDGASKATSRYIRFTTADAATLKIWWSGNGDNRFIHVMDEAGEEVAKTDEGATGKTPNISTLELPEAGTYTLATPDGTCLFMKVVVTEGAVEKAPRAAWDTVAVPEITSVKLVDEEEDGEKTTKIVVTVSALVGYDGGDDVTVIMRDADGWEKKKVSSTAEKSEHELKFGPSESGTYTFEVSSSRKGEDDIHKGAETKKFDFTYPLAVPKMKYAVNDGKGGLTVEWNSVKEATGYIVTAGDKTAVTTDVNATKVTLEGFKVGDKVEVTVAAVRDDETGEACDPVEVTVSDQAEIGWVFSAFGQSIDTENNGYEKLDNGDIRVYSINGKGKVQEAEQDGLAFYYTAIDPDTTNFVLSVTAKVNKWTYSNGQEGFGVLAMDRVGVHGTNDPIYCNSIMGAVTGFKSTFNGKSVTMRLGVGSLERSGVTELVTDKPATYTYAWRTLDTTGFDSNIRNLVGNFTNDPEKLYGPTLEPGLTEFKLILSKDDAGYHVTYIDPQGEKHTNDYLDPACLSYVDDYIYVGFFAARNMDVTFTDIQFTTSPASGAATPGESEEKTAAPDYSFKNPTVSNQEKFELDFRANVNGKVVITDAKGTELYKGVVKANEKVTVPVTLTTGDNAFKAVMTPDKDALTADGLKLTSYDEATVTTSVNFSVDTRTTIYVAPYGKADAKGTADDPTTLAAATKNPAPGATIILLEGTYQLTSGVTVDRGINGTEEKPITIKAVDNAATRPVLDWGEKGNGLRINGNWWHLIGFDSTRSTAKGVHIGGNHNVVERVCTYDNLNTGLSISRINFGEAIPDWPSYNTILNCSSWLNADSGYEDADGFEAKLTVGVGNVFDGCIAAYNADDGWDLYARGADIGPVTLKNCVSFKNGYDIVDGKEVNAGNGNGFKLGGNNYAVDHRIENSIAFANKANGFTCNSDPNLKVENCIAFGNKTGLSLYSTNSSLDTAFAVHGYIGFQNGDTDSIKAQGTQVKTDWFNNTNYYQGNSYGDAVSEDWFKSVDMNTAIASGITRNADGSISMNGFLELTDKAPADAGARLPGGQGQNYRDIIPGAWYYDVIEEMYAKGLMAGVAPSTFAPNEKVSRAMLAVVLHRMADNPAPKAASKSADVKKGDWFADAVAWVEENGILTGKDGKFQPNSPITRQEAVRALYLYAKTTGMDMDITGATELSAKFTDADKLEENATEAMTWAVVKGIITGTTPTTLSPDSSLTRAELATIASRLLYLLKK